MIEWPGTVPPAPFTPSSMPPLRRISLACLAFGCAAALPAQSVPERPAGARLAYPDTRKSAHVDTLHGQAVADPYRWLEDVDSPDTKAWVEAQNRVTFGYLEQLPERKMIRERLTQLWNYPRTGVPSKDGRYVFWTENTGLQNQNVVYVREGAAGAKRVLLDPNTLSSDGTAALSGGGRSRDGRLYAYAVALKGSDWSTMYVRDVATGKDLADTLQWLRGGGASWTNDAKGFFYVRYPAQEGNRHVTVTRGPKVYYHRLGTPQASDVLVYERPDQPEWYLGAGVSRDGRYLFVSAFQGTSSKSRLWYADLGDPQRPNVSAPIRPLFAEGDAAYGIVDNDGTTFYMMTDRGAQRSKLVTFDIARPEQWRTLVPESKDNLVDADVAGGKLLLQYLADARSEVRIHAKDGTPAGTIPLPGIGSLGGLSAQEDEDEVFYSFSSFVYPATVFRYNVRTGRNEVYAAPQVKNFDVSKYETRQVFYTSKDGTRVPMFITMRKGTKLDGNNPTLLYAYGGFDISITPGFSPANLVWLELGGIYAVANLRGGGEYGQAWHEAGMLDRKQNVFDDFIAAGEYLVANKYTSPAKLAIRGGSNGGLLVGAVMNQRPDLFGVAIPQVGVMDMLRFHKFTVGWGWQVEYGYPDSAAHFATLRKYSPLHNLAPGTRYPATLITTADHDDRVVPGHSFKYAAALQAAQAGEAPVLIRIETSAGHGAGKPTSKVIEETADIYAFALRNMNAKATLTP